MDEEGEEGDGTGNGDDTSKIKAGKDTGMPGASPSHAGGDQGQQPALIGMVAALQRQVEEQGHLLRTLADRLETAPSHTA